MQIRFFNTYEPVTSLYRDLVPLLTRRGDQVVIVVSRGRYRKARDLSAALRDDPLVRIVRTVNFGRHAYQGLPSKLAVTFGYLVHATLHAIFSRSVALNIFLTQPPFFPILGTVLRVLRRQPYWIVLMDLQPQLSVSLGLVKENAIWTRTLAWTTRLSLRRAQTVVVIGRCMAEYVEQLGVNPSRVRLIPNWADEREVVPIPHEENRLRRQEGWEGRFVVAYAGNLGLPQEFDDILEVAARLRNRADVLFAFIGEGVRAEWIRHEIARRRLTNVRQFPFLHDSIPLSDILSAGDVHFVSLKEACTGIAVPSKTYGVLAVGRPVIFQGSARCEIARLIVERGVGKVVPSGAVDELERVILGYADSPADTRVEGERARALAEGPYSRSQALAEYISLLGSLEGRA